MKFILAKKENMVQVFGEDGKVRPATVLTTGAMTVTQVKTKEKDGYNALQFGFGKVSGKNVSKAVKGHTKDLGSFAVIKESRIEDVGEMKKGDVVSPDIFAVGDKVTVAGISKGKGFQGVVKRHGFGGGPRSHGQKHSEREPGSIGGGGRDGGRVAKGMRMAGRMGGDRVTVKNLEIIALDKENNTIMVSGAIPGRRGTLVEVKSS